MRSALEPVSTKLCRALLRGAWSIVPCLSILSACAGSSCEGGPSRVTVTREPIAPPSSAGAALGLAALAPSAERGDAGVEPDIVDLARKAAAIQRRLGEQDVFVGTPEPIGLVVPVAVRTHLRELKDAALAVIEATLSAPPGGQIDRGAIRSAFVAGGVLWADDFQTWTDTSIDATIRPAPGHQERWGVDLCILALPGSDCFLALYERRGGRIRLALALRSDDYESVSGAHHAPSWTISPPDAADRYYVVRAHTHPWMSSNWRGFEYDAYAPTADSMRPERLAHGTGDAFWVDGFALEAKPEGFTVSFSSWGDGKHFTRTTVHEWRRGRTGFQRTNVRVVAPPPR